MLFDLYILYRVRAFRLMENIMAKGQQRKSREARKPKKEQPPKQNASNPSVKPGGIKGLENMKNG